MNTYNFCLRKTQWFSGNFKFAVNQNKRFHNKTLIANPGNFRGTNGNSSWNFFRTISLGGGHFALIIHIFLNVNRNIMIFSQNALMAGFGWIFWDLKGGSPGNLFQPLGNFSGPSLPYSLFPVVTGKSDPCGNHYWAPYPHCSTETICMLLRYLNLES